MFRLEQLYDQQLFFRDANQLEVLSNSQEVSYAKLTRTELSQMFSFMTFWAIVEPKLFT